ncbi:BPI fold-containing family B member 6-like isoform 1-T2 [Vipera latastei]
MDLVLKSSWIGLLIFFSVGMVHSEMEETCATNTRLQPETLMRMVQTFMTEGNVLQEVLEKATKTGDNAKTINGVGGMEIKEFHPPEICTELMPPNEIETSIITSLTVAETSFTGESMEIFLESKMSINVKMSKPLTEYIGTEKIRCEEPSSCKGNLPRSLLSEIVGKFLNATLADSLPGKEEERQSLEAESRGISLGSLQSHQQFQPSLP